MPAAENLTRDEARARAELLSNLHYDVMLDLTQGDEEFGVTAVITFDCSSPGSRTFVDCTARAVDRVVLNGEPVPRSGVDDTRIMLPPLGGTNELRIDATMGYLREGRGMHFFRDPADGAVYLHSQFQPFDTHLVYPCFDQPDLKATFDFSVRAPAGWTVVSNMAARSAPPPDSDGVWEFDRTPRLSTYVTAVIAGAYECVRSKRDDVDLGLFCRKSLAPHLEADRIFDLTRQGLDWFERVFDYRYPFGKYDQLFVPEFSAGAMENPGCVTFSESYLFRSKVTDASRERRAETLLHEMAHMWFGDLVTMRWWDDLWLNESFATFMSVLAQTQATRFTNGWVTFLDSEKAWAKYQDQLPSTHPIAADMHDIESVNQNFDGITYAKGASVLRQLVAWVGEQEFLSGCRTYFERHQYDNAELTDFLAALEDASGRDLDGWTDEWLETTGVNTLRVEVEDDGDLITAATVVQTAPDEHPTLRRHRIAIGLYDRGDDGTMSRRDRIEVDVDGPTTSLPQLEGQPLPDLLLPNDDDLTYTKIVLDDHSTAAVKENLAGLDDPLARALVWSATWDMVRDGNLPARRFVELVTRNVEAESEIGVVQRLQARALAATLRYGDPGNREALRRLMAATARKALERAEPGSDHQLAWARNWASSASGDELGEVRRLLDGDLVIDGLDVDVELRWHLVTALAQAGAVGADVIEAERQRDPTDLGQRHALAALASRPLADAKEEAWGRIVDDPDLSHTLARELFHGFQQLDQEAVLAPYTERYFDALPGIWDSRSREWAIEFTEGTFPHSQAGTDLLERVDAFVADDGISGPLRRALLEQRDTVRRTVTARRVDAEAS